LVFGFSATIDDEPSSSSVPGAGGCETKVLVVTVPTVTLRSTELRVEDAVLLIILSSSPEEAALVRELETDDARSAADINAIPSSSLLPSVI